MDSINLTLVLLFVAIFSQASADLSNGISEKQLSLGPLSRLSQPPFLGDTAKGTVWPEPQQKSISPQTYSVEVSNFAFKFNPESPQCTIITEAFKRYEKIIYKAAAKMKLHYTVPSDTISTLEITLLSSECEVYPSLGMNEAYTLDIVIPAKLQAESVWGVLRGLETFTQLLYKGPTGEVTVNKTSIVDFPRFGYRGVLLDTSRHYLPVDVIKKNLDAMSYNKFNVFHWHIVDIQSFPFVSLTFPELSAKGSYNPGSNTHIYTPHDVQEVIEYARLRGIRVVPEFDTPGHTTSWGLGQPNLLTPCYTDNKPDGTFGPINPIIESNYDFIRNLFTEVKSVFPDSYIHLGGDEVSFNCWKSNPDINAWMKQMNMTTYNQLEQYYIQKVLTISEQIGYSYTVWQEVIDNGVQIKNDTVVEVWKSGEQAETAKVTKLGYNTIISSPWYLNEISYGQDWMKFYVYEPLSFNGKILCDDENEVIVQFEQAMMKKTD